MAAAVAISDWPIDAMAYQIKDSILAAFRQLLRPLVRILLRNGITYADYADVSRTVFVETAAADFGLSEQRNSVHRIALLTGLTRRDVTEVNSLIRQRPFPTNINLDRIGRVLAGWHQDPDFTGPYGLPLELNIDKGDESFASLINRYCPEVSADEMLIELERIGAVNVVAGTRVRVLTRNYIPGQADPAIAQFMGVALRDLAETLDFNLNPSVEGGYFERRVWTPAGIDPREVPAFDRLVHEKGQEFLETLDNYLGARETEAENLAEQEKVHVGVGVFMFSDERYSKDD